MRIDPEVVTPECLYRGLVLVSSEFPIEAFENDRINPKPTLFLTREASEPYSRGQWDSGLSATPHPPEGDVACAGA
jgi:hypothetical protein